MERPQHSMSNLFAQLGEPCDEQAIALFIETRRPLSAGMLLHEASFWSPSQASFLRDALCEDADWAEVVDALNTELH